MNSWLFWIVAGIVVVGLMAYYFLGQKKEKKEVSAIKPEEAPRAPEVPEAPEEPEI